MTAFWFVMKSSISVKDSLSSLCYCGRASAFVKVMLNDW